MMCFRRKQTRLLLRTGKSIAPWVLCIHFAGEVYYMYNIHLYTEVLIHICYKHEQLKLSNAAWDNKKNCILKYVYYEKMTKQKMHLPQCGTVV